LVVACAPQQREQTSGFRASPEQVEKKVSSLLAELTLAEKISLVHANSKFTVAGVPRLGIPEMWLSDGPHGVREQISKHSWASANWNNDYATYLPPLTGVAASWDKEMARLHGSVLGAEARHRNKDIILGPGVNLARLPTYGRNFEYFGEDPFLTSSMVVPEIQAIQQHDVAACVKHYALNTQELNRRAVDNRPDERTLREVYLPAFEAAVTEAGVWTVMGAYNQVYGTNANQNRHLIQDILKGDWGFNGVLLTDWYVDINTRDAAMNGLDLEMGSDGDYDDYFLAEPFKKMIEQGEIPESVLDDKVRRILRMQLSIGMMDPNRKEGERNTTAHRAAAQKIIEQGIVLLKNDRELLPIDRQKIKRILVLGPNANLEHGRGGGSSQVKTNYEITPLQGLRDALGTEVELEYMRLADSDGLQPLPGDYVATRHNFSGVPAWKVHEYADEDHKQYQQFDQWYQPKFNADSRSTLRHFKLEATIQPLQSGAHKLLIEGAGKIQLSVAGKTVIDVTSSQLVRKSYPLNLQKGKTYDVTLSYDGNQQFTLGMEAPGLKLNSLQEAVSAARKVDAVIYFGGLSHIDDREGLDRESMRLPGNQDVAIQKIRAVNPNTVVFLIGGSAVEMPWIDQIETLVWGWYGGMHGGDAYARVLLGDVNPSGKMPITLPVSLEHSAPIALQDYNDQQIVYKEGVFVGYRWFEKNNRKPLFPFGYGLSYTQFELSNLELPKVFSENTPYSVSVTVKNTGKRAGAEVVQLYLGDEQASVERPRKELKGFEKVYLEPGESRRISIPLKLRDLSFWDVKTSNWKAEPGAFNVYVGTSSADIKMNGRFELF